MMTWGAIWSLFNASHPRQIHASPKAIFDWCLADVWLWLMFGWCLVMVDIWLMFGYGWYLADVWLWLIFGWCWCSDFWIVFHTPRVGGFDVWHCFRRYGLRFFIIHWFQMERGDPLSIGAHWEKSNESHVDMAWDSLSFIDFKWNCSEVSGPVQSLGVS